MTTPVPQRPSLFSVVMSRLLIAAVLTLCIVAAYTIFDAFSDKFRVAGSYVRLETSALLKNARLSSGQISLPALDGLSHYSVSPTPKYALRVLDENGKILVLRNGEVFGNFIERPALKPGNGARWTITNSRRPFWIAGGVSEEIDGQAVYAEVATLGDPAWRRSHVFFQEILINGVMWAIPLLLMTIGIAAFLLNTALAPLRQAAENAGRSDSKGIVSNTEFASLPSEGVKLVGAINRLREQKVDGWASIKKSLSEAIHETRSSLALITLQVNKLPDKTARQIEDDVDSVSGLIERISALTKKGSGKTD